VGKIILVEFGSDGREGRREEGDQSINKKDSALD